MHTNWEAYSNNYPIRYMKYSKFDSIVQEHMIAIEDNGLISALDVGGGVNGTLVLQNERIVTDILDPNVEKPYWMRDSVSWDTVCGPYDLIVARNSLNYLSLDNIRMLPKLLCDYGYLYINTFRKPEPYTVRRYISLSENTGWEVAVFDEQSCNVHHMLLPDDATEPIEHDFHYYSIDVLIEAVGRSGLTLMCSGGNGLIIIKQNK